VKPTQHSHDVPSTWLNSLSFSSCATLMSTQTINKRKSQVTPDHTYRCAILWNLPLSERGRGWKVASKNAYHWTKLIKVCKWRSCNNLISNLFVDSLLVQLLDCGVKYVVKLCISFHHSAVSYKRVRTAAMFWFKISTNKSINKRFIRGLATEKPSLVEKMYLNIDFIEALIFPLQVISIVRYPPLHKCLHPPPPQQISSRHFVTMLHKPAPSSLQTSRDKLNTSVAVRHLPSTCCSSFFPAHDSRELNHT
jgi:hypothetical protein